MTQPLRRAPLAAIVLGLAAALPATVGCTKHEIEVKPIRVEPIYMTIDVNVKVQRELDDFFAFEEEIEGSAKPKSK